MTTLEFLKRKLWLEKRDSLELLVIWAIGFAGFELLGNLLFLFLRDDGDAYFPVASLLLLIFGVFYLVLLVAVRFTVTFQLGLQMSVTRRRMLLGEWAVSVLEVLQGLILLYLSFWIDHLVFGTLWGGILPEDNLLFLIPWWGWLLAGLGALLVGFICGALMSRFGLKGFWVLWGVCVGFALLTQFVGDPLFDFVAAHGLPFGAGGIVLFLALTVFSFVQMLRFPVK